MGNVKWMKDIGRLHQSPCHSHVKETDYDCHSVQTSGGRYGTSAHTTKWKNSHRFYNRRHACVHVCVF